MVESWIPPKDFLGFRKLNAFVVVLSEGGAFSGGDDEDGVGFIGSAEIVL
jgi:hypothetical protein